MINKKNFLSAMKSMIFYKKSNDDIEKILSECLDMSFGEPQETLNEGYSRKEDLEKARNRFMNLMSKCRQNINSVFYTIPQSLQAIPEVDKSGRKIFKTDHIKSAYQFMYYDPRDTYPVDKTDDGRKYFIGRIDVHKYYIIYEHLGSKDWKRYICWGSRDTIIQHLDKRKNTILKGFTVHFTKDYKELITNFGARKEDVEYLAKNETTTDLSFVTKNTQEFREDYAKLGDDPKYHEMLPIYFIVTDADISINSNTQYEDLTPENGSNMIRVSDDGYIIEVSVAGIAKSFTYDVLTHRWSYYQGRLKAGQERQQRYPRLGNPALPLKDINKSEFNMANKIAKVIEAYDKKAPEKFTKFNTYLRFLP